MTCWLMNLQYSTDPVCIKYRVLCQKIYTMLNHLCIFYSTVLIKKWLLFTRNIIGTVFACIKFKEGGLRLRNLH